jgi:type IV fimbrial biogenesis protein FimT
VLGGEEEILLMKALPTTKSAGFTLTELMIAIAVFSVLGSFALPNFRQMMRNKQVGSAAESVANGLQRARAEAVARNARIKFVLGSGTSWTVDYVTKPVSTDPPIDARASNETANATLVAKASDLSTAATTITFNQLGQVVANADASATLSRVTFSASGATQSLQVRIGAGGNAKVCDPSLPSTNVRAC